MPEIEVTPRLSIVMAYYNNPGMLIHQYAMFRSYPDHVRRSIEYIVVDDHSIDGKEALPPAEPWDIPITIGRMAKKVRWNQDACRNWGVSQARADWLLLTDMDHLIPAETLADLLLMPWAGWPQNEAYRLSRRNYGTMEPYKPHPNSWVMPKAFFDRVGGYDERFAGYYGTDGDFVARLRKWTEISELPQYLIRVGREHIEDASTPREYGRKSDRDGEQMRRMKKERGNKPPKRGTFQVDVVYRGHR